MSHADDRYYVPHGSHWPIVGSIGLLFLMVGVSTWLNGADMGFWVMLSGVAIVIFMMIGWFGTVIARARAACTTTRSTSRFVWACSGSFSPRSCSSVRSLARYFYARNMSIPWLAGESNNFFTNLLLWTGYEATWPTNGPAEVGGDFQTMGPFGLPLINTAILLTSSVTITIAHHALIAGHRKILNGSWRRPSCLALSSFTCRALSTSTLTRI